MAVEDTVFAKDRLVDSIMVEEDARSILFLFFEILSFGFLKVLSCTTKVVGLKYM